LNSVRPVTEAWRKLSKDSSPDALMFPTFGRGERKGQAVPRWGKNFLRWRIRPVARKLGIPDRLGHLPGDAPDAGDGHAVGLYESLAGDDFPVELVDFLSRNVR
jgi:hypothetical protein